MTHATGSMPYAPEPLRTKAEHAYHELRARILTGELAPGAIVSSEYLAAELGLSATPIREALRRLAADDLVVLSAHRDVRIKPLSRAEITGLYAVLCTLDTMAASLACQHATDDELAIPGALLDRARGDAGHREQLMENRAFHRSIYSRSGNEVLNRLLDSLWDRTDRYRLLLLQPRHRAKEAEREHAEMARAFADRDADRLSSLLESHTAGSLDMLLAQLPPSA